MRDAVETGAWVEVFGVRDKKAKTVAAQTVLFRDDGNRKLTGLAVIEKVVSTAPELVFAADGYRIRVTPATEVKFPHDLKSTADVHAGMWVLYEGKLGQDGLLVAGKARFVSTNHAKLKSEKSAGDSGEPATTPQPPANGGMAAKETAPPPKNASDETDTQVEFRGKDIEFGGTTYRISKDEALQSRVRRVGMTLVPVYQKRLPASTKSGCRQTIHRRFSSSFAPSMIRRAKCSPPTRLPTKASSLCPRYWRRDSRTTTSWPPCWPTASPTVCSSKHRS